jgi:predicted ATPase/DNA-binding CsgD family transcriptional regulator
VGDAAVAAAGSVHGLVPALTSFVGREAEVGKAADLLGGCRLVTVTGPGGVGKTRLAAEVARRVAGRFADGVWLVELAAVQESALVAAAVAVALQVHQPSGTSLVEALAAVLARRQLLLVLDNCEHLLDAVAELCGTLLSAADDVRVLATSREPLGLAGETRYRLPPLTLPGPDDPAGTAGSEAVALFADRARQADPEFALTGESSALMAQVVARLDGMPLAIELAAARVESLGMGQLVERLDHRFALLTSGDRRAARRQRSLAATVEWSYQLLAGDEQLVFRQLAVFPGPFTLEAAETVAGAAAEAAVLHLVDCSLLTPPRTGPDGRARYLMLETLRAYGLQRLADAGERPGADAALAGHALQVAEQAAAGLQTSAGERAAARWLDAEDPITQQALTWALDQDQATALRLAVALAPWWFLRGRGAAGYGLLRAAVGDGASGSRPWRAGQFWLGFLAIYGSDYAAGLDHFTALCDASATTASPELIDGLAGRAQSLRNQFRLPEAFEDARRALELARRLSYRAGEARALAELSVASYYGGDAEDALRWARQAQQIDAAEIPGHLVRRRDVILMLALLLAGEEDAARQTCAQGLARAREAGDLSHQADFACFMADLDMQSGHLTWAGAHIRESLGISVETGNRLRLLECLDACGHLCAATGRPAEALTLWAAQTTCNAELGIPDLPEDARRRGESRGTITQILGPAQTRAAEERGAAMTLDTAVEFATMVTEHDPQAGPTPPATGQLSPREQELVTLVARGHTDTQIAGQLYISVRTVRSHLDRIRDKTGYRRRADLTRLALQAGLV